ncbi:bifunctional DNA-formamidopyrimidine glycosylase/DNA-(apurinic or apyrimidinic site) lyase [Mycoplasma sp. CSL7491-lung]|uniref:bifunctional DNA-formamidopyrimidine glycosylase/DNA-(apurinic or apyrimidinic site) lyase n=1 Tax=Mycoplasma sp. CSL7491-lung TaxID=549718 RepID=UPI001C103E4C|nr:bifunctional DNA-formamidopyrimidine glycosylase/DNA-(apurinic or apyrimidinic site) lyase [Mycoplasma sp. CSL7491-lung]MBU4692716.1 bifunctional DNA-formamidopyrimidine glycosylase/DNA-(apurinic or apyrimidinic site) lyase [Mycoplasma sp. CSL7491-lung]
MPEYPEVTVVQRALNKHVQDKKILKVEVKISKLIKNTDEKNFISFLKNKIISNIENIGKFLIFNFNDKSRLISHLRMTGKYFVRDINDPALYAYRGDCIYFTLDNQKVLVYNDSRMFGSFEILPSEDQRSIYEIKNLAFLPESVDVDALFNKLKRKTISIKKVLLDQSLVLGIGNIYADESLHMTKIYPMTPANKITKNELKQLLINAQKVMDQSIIHNGSTVNSYASVNGISGEFQNFLKVYGRENQICSTCQSDKIVKVKLDFKPNGRGTSYCPTCQKER